MSARISRDKPLDTPARSRLVRDASGLMAATYVSQILAFGIGIVTKGLLGPDELGVWTQLLAVLSFMGLLEFGIMQATNKEISYALSKGDEAAADRYKRVQFSFVAITSLIGLVGLTAYTLWRGAGDDMLSRGMLFIALMLPISQMHLGQVTVYWANHRFGPTSLLMIVETVLAGVVGLLLVWQFGIVGQIVSFFLILLVKLLTLAWLARGEPPLQIGFGWSRADLMHLLKSGIPLLLISLSNVTKLSGTVFLISYYFDTHSVGYYSLALSVQNFIYWTPNAFSVVMFPRFQARYAESNDQAAALRTYLVKPTIGLAFFLLPVLLSATYFCVPPLIDHALPAYHSTIAILVVMLPGTFFLSLEHMPSQFLMTINRLWGRVTISLLSLVLIAVCLAPAILLGGSILHFVASLSIANLLGFVILLLHANHYAKGTRSDCRLISAVLCAFLYLVAVTLAVDHWVPASHGTWQLDLLVASGKWFLVMVLLLPLFIVAESKLGLLSAAGGLIRQLRAHTS